MAGLVLIGSKEDVTCTAATQTHVLGLDVAANSPIKILGWGIYFNGTSATNAPINVKLRRTSTTGTGWGTDDVTPTKLDDSRDVTPITDVRDSNPKTNANLGTADGDLDIVEVHPQSGYEVRYPFGQEPVIGGDAASWVVIDVTAANTVTCSCKILFEE